MPGPQRLQKLLARAGVASRRAAEDLVLAGRVTVNGTVVDQLGSRADPRVDDVRLDGERLRDERPTFFALHKPTGVVTTLEDPQGRKTIRPLLPSDAGRVFPVGRLDYNSAGLLLVTNDGDLAAALLHPRNQVPRTYLVKVSGRPTRSTLAHLRRGVKLDDGKTGPADVEIEQELPNKTWLRVTIREGRRREVRRMCESVGHQVDKLVRVSFGPIELGRLRVGTWRPLSAAEVDALRDAARPGSTSGTAARNEKSKRRSAPTGKPPARRGRPRGGSRRRDESGASPVRKRSPRSAEPR